MRRGTFGLVIQAITADLAEALALPKSTGALVKSVQKGMPAVQAGIVSGDIILRIGNEAVHSPGDVARLAASLKPGTTVSVEVLRFKGRRLEKLNLEVADASD